MPNEDDSLGLIGNCPKCSHLVWVGLPCPECKRRKEKEDKEQEVQKNKRRLKGGLQGGVKWTL